jgi:hypothetical protein
MLRRAEAHRGDARRRRPHRPTRFGGREVETAGIRFSSCSTAPKRAIRCGLELVDALVGMRPSIRVVFTAAR